MDIYGQNLNRYYNNCTLAKQYIQYSYRRPSIFGLKSLMEQYSR